MFDTIDEFELNFVLSNIVKETEEESKLIGDVLDNVKLYVNADYFREELDRRNTNKPSQTLGPYEEQLLRRGATKKDIFGDD